MLLPTPAQASPLKPLASYPQPPLACGLLMPAETSPPAHLLMAPLPTALLIQLASTSLINAFLTHVTPELLMPHALTFPLSTERSESFVNGKGFLDSNNCLMSTGFTHAWNGIACE